MYARLLLVGLTLLLLTTALPLRPLANTIQGTAIDIPAIDDAAATGDKYMHGSAGKMLARGLLIGGLFIAIGGKYVLGGLSAGSGLGLGLIFGMGSQAIDNAPAATEGLRTVARLPWWDPLGLFYDPTFWVSCVLMLCLHGWYHHARRRSDNVA